MVPATPQQNLAGSLRRALAGERYALLERISRFAEEGGDRLYLVGGAVRDLLLQQRNLDIDLAVEGNAPALARSLARQMAGRAKDHRQFGTGTLYVNNMRFDLATARTEQYPAPGALPQVQPGSIGDDLRRRDFTINAMAVSLMSANFGELLDPLGGRADLDAGLIRVLHDGSFVDDPTRLWRALRYQARLGFRLESHTQALLERDLHRLTTVSGDRVRNELLRALEEREPERALTLAQETGALALIHPALQCDDWLAERFSAARRVGQPAPRLYLALLAYRLSPDQVGQLVSRLALPTTLARPLQHLSRLKQRLPGLTRPSLLRSQVHAALAGVDEVAVAACGIASEEAIREHCDLYLKTLRHARPELDGTALLQMGIPQGPRIGQALAALLRARLDGEVNSVEEEKALASRWLPKTAASKGD